MKKLVFTFLFLLLLLPLQGQYYFKEEHKQVRLELSSVVTRSIHGRKMGFSVNVNINQRWHINYFDLKSYNSNEFDDASFRGGQVRYFFNPKARFSVGGAVKVGYYNQYFLSILPSLQTRYQLSGLIHLGGGVAYSDGFPYFDLEVGLKLFEK